MSRSGLFDGPTIEPKRDDAPLKEQAQRVRVLMLDQRWRTLEEIGAAKNISNLQSVSARVRDMRKTKWGGYTVERRIRAGHKRLFEYRINLHPPKLS